MATMAVKRPKEVPKSIISARFYGLILLPGVLTPAAHFQYCTKLSPRFAPPKPLKSRPGPGCCKTARL